MATPIAADGAKTANNKSKGLRNIEAARVLLGQVGFGGILADVGHEALTQLPETAATSCPKA